MLSYRTHHRLPRAFSLLETVVVLGLVALLAIAIIPNLNVEQSAAENTRSQVNLEATLDSQIRVKDATGSFADPDEGLELLAETNPEVSFVGPETASPNSRTVSTSLPEPEVVVAVSLGEDSTCWVVRRDFAASSDSPTAVHAYFSTSTPAAVCTAEYAAAQFSASLLSELAGAEGTSPGVSWQRPYELR